MRDVSPELAAIQEMTEGSRIPYIHLEFVADDELTTDYSDRWIIVDQWDTLYGMSAAGKIVLSNHDRAVIDLRETWIEIGWGDYVDGTPQYEPTQRMWVVDQTWVSSPNGLVSIVTLEDAMQHVFGHEEWDIMGAAPGFRTTFNRINTVYELLQTMMVFAFTIVPTGFTLTAPDTFDSIIDTLKPFFIINDLTWNPAAYLSIGAYENFKSIITRLISLTESYLRPEPNLTYKIIFPQDEDAVDMTYYSDKSPQFYEHHYKLVKLIPDKITVYYNATFDEVTGNLAATTYDPDTGAILTTAWDDYLEASSGSGSCVKHYMFPTIDNADDAVNMAAAILAHLKSGIFSEGIVIPNDCRLELLDKIQIQDNRGTPYVV